MADIVRYWEAAELDVGTSAIPELISTMGTNFPVPGYAFTQNQNEALYKRFVSWLYGSGNLVVHCDFYSPSATGSTVTWGAAIAVITPTTDSQSVLTDAFATENTTTSVSVAGTGRIYRTTVNISNLDSIAAGDSVEIRVRRTDNSLAGDVVLIGISLAYSDT